MFAPVFAPVLLAASLSATPMHSSAAPTDASVAAETEAWDQKRLKGLTSEEGWLSVVGLLWMEPGDNSAGSAKGSALEFPADAPAKLGTFHLENGKVTFTVAPGVAATVGGKPFTSGTLKSDAEGEPDVVSVGTLRFHIIQRNDRVGVRVKDTAAPARKELTHIPRYPALTKWRIEGKWEPAATPRKLHVNTVLGTVDEMTSYGTVAFTIDGKEYHLMPVQDSPTDTLFFIFADPTNKTETYGAGRFLYSDPPKDPVAGAKVVLDFNRAFNPPCAFTAFATCPLPPRENRLTVPITAGEKRAGHH